MKAALGAKSGSQRNSFSGIHRGIEAMNRRVFKSFILGVCVSCAHVCLAPVKSRLRSQGREQSHFRGRPVGQATESSRPLRQGSDGLGCTGGRSPRPRRVSWDGWQEGGVSRNQAPRWAAFPLPFRPGTMDSSSLFRSIGIVLLFSAISFQAHGSVLMAELHDGSKSAPTCE